MPYYRGDYYRGDNYYAAGGLFGSIGKIIGKVAKTAIGFTPIGKAVQIASRVLPVARKVLGPLGGAAGAAITARQLITPRTPGLLTPVEQFGEPGGMISGGGMLGGGGGGFGRSRRMNVTNVKALRRAGRRVRGFLKLARRFGALPISPKGKKLFRAKRR